MTPAVPDAVLMRAGRTLRRVVGSTLMPLMEQPTVREAAMGEQWVAHWAGPNRKKRTFFV